MSEEKQLTHSERMAELREKGETIKGALDTLLTCKEEGNLKQVTYWVGKVSHDMGMLCKECLGEELVKEMSKRRIIT